MPSTSTYIVRSLNTGSNYWSLKSSNNLQFNASDHFSDGYTILVGEYNNGAGSAFLIVNNTGTETYFQETIPNNTGTIYSVDVKIDSDNNWIVLQRFNTNYFTTNTSISYYYPVISKYSKNGILLWKKYLPNFVANSNQQRTIYDRSLDRGSQLVIDSTGTIYTFLNLNDGASPDQDSIAPYVSQDNWLWKLTPNGNINRLRISNHSNGVIRGINLTSDNKFILSGLDFNSGVIFPGGANTRTSRYLEVKYPDGTRYWSYNLETVNEYADNQPEYAVATLGVDVSQVLVDGSNNIYMLGASRNTVTSGTNKLHTNLVKFNSTPFNNTGGTGTVVWQKLLDINTSTNANLRGRAALYDDNIYWTAIHGNDILVSKISTASTASWHRRISLTGVNAGNLGWNDIKINSADNAYMIVANYQTTATNDTSTSIVIKLPLDGSLTGTYTDFTYSTATNANLYNSSWRLKSPTVAAGLFGEQSSTATNFAEIIQPDIDTQADFNFIAAPGFIKLGQADLDSRGYGGRESGSYQDDGYYTPEDYIGIEDPNTGTFNATLTLGTSIISASTSSLFAAPTNTLAISTQTLVSDSNTLFNAGRIFRPNITTSSITISAFSSRVIKRTSVISSSDIILNSTATVTRSAVLNSTCTSVSTLAGNMIYDIGIAYAIDWVRLEDEYVLPYFYSLYSVDTSLTAAASVEIVPEANITATCDIQGNGGYFISFAQSLLGAQTDLAMQQFQVGTSAGVIMRPTLPTMSVDTAQASAAGRIFRQDIPLHSPSTATILAGLDLPSHALMAVDADITAQTDLFKASTQNIFTASLQVNMLVGYGLFGQTLLAADFTQPPTLSRIISIDEYYIDRVPREPRTLAVWPDWRTWIMDAEIRHIDIGPETRQWTVAAEQRRLRPEPGQPQQAGKRIRRTTL